MAINKVVYGNTTLVDLTEDTVTEEDVMEGKTFHDKSGLKRTGSATQGGRVQDVEVNGESVVNAQGVAEVVVPVIDDENITNESVYSSEKIEDRLDEYVDKDVAEEKSATDEFTTINGGLLSECKVSLSPNQDLHGYPEPWVGGASKNKMPLTVENIKAWNTDEAWSGNTQTVAGMSFTILTDDANNVIGIDENGTTSSYPALKIFRGTLNGSYILCKNNARCRVYVNGSQVNDGTSDYTFTASGEQYDINLFTGAVTLNHQVVKPMLVLSTETDYTFEPYSNICPITGHTEVEVDVSDGQTTQEQVTVNLGGTYYSGTLDVVSGRFVVTHALTDFDSFTWTYNNDYSMWVSNSGLALAKDNTPLICERVRYNSIATTDAPNMGTKINRTYNVWVRNGSNTTQPSGKGLYELANPTPIQLTPQQVQALIGENHLSAPLDGQEIDEVKYKEAFDFNDVIKVANYFTLPLQTFTFTNKVCNINDSRITSDSLVDVYFTSDSMSSVEDAGITVESQNGKIVMTAEEQPVGTIQGRIKVVN